MKQCAKCKEEKEASGFYKNASSRDGLTARCKACLYTKRDRPRGRIPTKRRGDKLFCPSCSKWIHETQWYHRNGGKRNSYCIACTRRKSSEVYEAKRKTITSLKRMLVDKMGGGCERCGYNEFMSGIDFHHTESKDEGMSLLMFRWGMGGKKAKARLLKAIEREAEKCILLCRNCHMALHSGEWKE